MKKIIIICMASIMMSMIGMEEAKAVIEITVGLRTKSSGCASGFGLCAKVVILDIWEYVWGVDIVRGGESYAIKAKSSIDEKKNVYILTFSANELEKKDPIAYKEMQKGKFNLDEDIKLPIEANKAYNLNRTTQVTLKKGVYNVNQRGDVVTVEVDIK